MDKPYIYYDYDENNDEETEIEVSKNYIEYRDVPRLQASQWISEILTKEISKRLKLTNFCPAIGEEMTDPYPKTFKEFISMWDIKKGIGKYIMSPFVNRMYKEDLKLAKNYYPKELYEYLFDSKFTIK